MIIVKAICNDQSCMPPVSNKNHHEPDISNTIVSYMPIQIESH